MPDPGWKAFKTSGVNQIFIADATTSDPGLMSAADKAKLNSLSPGGGATIYANFAAFPAAGTVPGQFAIDSAVPGGGQGSLYCAFGGNWCFIAILAP